MAGISAKGRTYSRGKAANEDLRTIIIDKIVSDGGDMATGYFGGSFKDIANIYRVSETFVVKIWNQVCETLDHLPSKRTSGNPPHLQREDIDVVELLKLENPSKSYKSIKENIDSYCNVNGGTSLTAIGNVVRNKLSEGPFTRKRLAKPSSDKFTPVNLNYCQNFLDTISTLPPECLKFFDEAGVHSGSGNSVYGHSLRGTHAIEISKNKKGANVTLNLLCGLEGVLYANTVEGSSDTMTFLDFFDEAGQATTDYGNPAIEFGDYIILDNCAIHRFEAAQTLHRWLMLRGANLIFTPSLSPEFNAAEYCFNKMKYTLKREEFAPILRQNVHAAIYQSLGHINVSDMYGFYSKLL